MLQLVLRQLARIDGHSALGAAVGDPHRGALPGHQHGQRLDQVEVDVGVVADAAFGRTAADVVLDTPAGEDVDRAVVHADREMDGQLSFDLSQAASRVVGKADDVRRGVKPALCGLEGGSASFDRHVATSDSNSRERELRTLARQHLAGIVLVALVALATGFVLAGQVPAQLLTPSNQVARYQALARNVQELEATNADARREIASLRAQIDALESEAATR